MAQEYYSFMLNRFFETLVILLMLSHYQLSPRTKLEDERLRLHKSMMYSCQELVRKLVGIYWNEFFFLNFLWLTIKLSRYRAADLSNICSEHKQLWF